MVLQYGNSNRTFPAIILKELSLNYYNPLESFKLAPLISDTIQ